MDSPPKGQAPFRVGSKAFVPRFARRSVPMKPAHLACGLAGPSTPPGLVVGEDAPAGKRVSFCGSVFDEHWPRDYYSTQTGRLALAVSPWAPIRFTLGFTLGADTGHEYNGLRRAITGQKCFLAAFCRLLRFPIRIYRFREGSVWSWPLGDGRSRIAVSRRGRSRAIFDSARSSLLPSTTLRFH